MSPATPQRSTSSLKCAAYARIAPSTASMCLRSESPAVHSCIRARAASRAGSGAPAVTLRSPADEPLEIAVLLSEKVGGGLLLRVRNHAQRVRHVRLAALAIVGHEGAKVAHGRLHLGLLCGRARGRRKLIVPGVEAGPRGAGGTRGEWYR